MKNIQFRPIRSTDIPAIRVLIGQIFASAEPMSKYLKISETNVRSLTDQFLSPYCLDTLDISYLAEDISSSPPTPVAFVICTPLDEKIDTDLVADEIMPLLNIMNILDQHFLATHPNVSPKNVLHLLVGGTKNEYEGSGISKRLREHIFEVANKMNIFHYCVVECSNTATQHIMNKYFGFQKELEIPYKNFEYKGVKIFEELTQHYSVALMVKKLGDGSGTSSPSDSI